MSPEISHVISAKDPNSDHSALSLPTTFAWIFELKAAGVRYIDSPEFHERDAMQRIDTGPEVLNTRADRGKSSDVFLGDISRYPLLTAEQEAPLFRKYNYLKYLVSVELQTLPAEVSPHELDRLARIEELWTNAQSVRERLLLSNLRLVPSVAKTTRSQTLTQEELWSLGGELILTRAIETFDYMRAYRFSSYAVISLQRAFSSACKAEVRRSSRLVGSDGSSLSSRPESLMAEENKATQASLLLKELLSKLADPRATEVLLLRFGLSEEREPLTFEQIAKRVGLSKQRIQQIEAQSLEELQRILVLNRKIGELPSMDIPTSLLDRRHAAHHTQTYGLDTFKQYVVGALRSGPKRHATLTKLVKSSYKNVMRLAIAELLHHGEIEIIASVGGKRKTEGQTEYQIAQSLTR